MRRAAEHYFIKYGEISRARGRAEDCLMKQKHRLMWERRHGPVGTGMKTDDPQPPTYADKISPDKFTNTPDYESELVK